MAVDINMKYFILLLLLTFGCGREQQKDKIERASMPINSVDYSLEIEQIAKEKDALHSFDVVFTSEKFVHIYETPTAYLDSSLAFLSRNQSEDAERVAILSMNKLGLDNYVEFTYSLFKLSESNIISSEILNFAINFSFTNEPVLVKNYDSKIVQKLFAEIKEGEHITIDLKDRIEYILSGEAWNELKKFKKDSGM